MFLLLGTSSHVRRGEKGRGGGKGGGRRMRKAEKGKKTLPYTRLNPAIVRYRPLVLLGYPRTGNVKSPRISS